MKLRSLASAAMLGALPITPAFGQQTVATLTGVATVQDGDGVLFGKVEVRLQGIAAPELKDSMGRESYLGLADLAEGKDVVCELDGTTANRRPVGVCYVDGQDIGRQMIVAGLARDCPRYSKGRYRDAEAQAARAGRDLSAVYELPGYC